jgi:chaperonin GroES
MNTAKTWLWSTLSGWPAGAKKILHEVLKVSAEIPICALRRVCLPECRFPPKYRQCGKTLKEELSVTIRPLYDRVVVRRVEAETTSRGGIIIPDKAAEKPNQGVVTAVGPGALLENGETRPLAVSVGDRVLFGKYAATEQTIGGEELLIVRETDILAIVEQENVVEKAA